MDFIFLFEAGTRKGNVKYLITIIEKAKINAVSSFLKNKK
jgi:hypothetical protein